MGSMRKILHISGNNFKKWAVNPRLYALAVLVAVYLHSMILPIWTFCSETGYKITPWVFPFLLTEPFTLPLVMIGVVLLFCDAPFIDAEQPYIMLRSGRICWTVGQLLYIAFASAVYFLSLFLLSVVFLVPYISFESGWGKVINTFCKTGMADKYKIPIPFSNAIVSTLPPIRAVLWELLLCWLIGTFIGLLMFSVNLTVSRNAGAITGAALCIFPMFVSRTNWRFYYFCPVSWASLAVVDFSGTATFPSVYYAAGVLITTITILSLWAVLAMRRRDIDILKIV